MKKYYSHHVIYLIIIIIFLSCNESNPVTSIFDDDFIESYKDSVIYLSGGNIYIMNKNGSGDRKLTNFSSFVSNPRWSSNKKVILFVSDSENLTNGQSLYSMDYQGNNVKRLSTNDEYVFYGEYSPDMKKIAYIICQDNNAQIKSEKIKILDINTNISKEITDWFTGIRKLSWSHDSKKIFFSGSEDTSYQKIHEINDNGSGLKILLNSAQAFEPSVSPDGQNLLFLAYETVNWRTFPLIHIYNFATKETKLLHKNTEIQFQSTWSNDGSQIIFSERNSSQDNLFLINLDGSSYTRITDSNKRASYPCWCK